MGHYVWNDRKGKAKFAPDIVDRLGVGVTDWMGGGFDTMSNVLNVFVKAGAVLGVLAVVGLIVYLVAADLVLGYFGIIKAKTPVTVSVSESTVAEDASIVAVSHKKEPVVGEFAIENGQAVVKSTTHQQSLYLSYDGLLVDNGAYASPSIVEPTSVAAEYTTSRALIVTVRGADGNAIAAGEVGLKCSNASAVRGTTLDDGRIVLLMPEDAAGLTLTFSAEGYEAQEVSMDWNAHRLGEMEVYLHAK